MRSDLVFMLELWFYLCIYSTFNDAVINSDYITKTNSVALVRNRTIPSDRRLPAKLVPTFEDRGCRVVSATDPHGRILGFLDWSRYYFFQVAPQLYSRG
jgi:hypothetical protein